MTTLRLERLELLTLPVSGVEDVRELGGSVLLDALRKQGWFVRAVVASSGEELEVLGYCGLCGCMVLDGDEARALEECAPACEKCVEDIEQRGEACR